MDSKEEPMGCFIATQKPSYLGKNNKLNILNVYRKQLVSFSFVFAHHWSFNEFHNYLNIYLKGQLNYLLRHQPGIVLNIIPSKVHFIIFRCLPYNPFGSYEYHNNSKSSSESVSNFLSFTTLSDDVDRFPEVSNVQSDGRSSHMYSSSNGRNTCFLCNSAFLYLCSAAFLFVVLVQIACLQTFLKFLSNLYPSYPDPSANLFLKISIQDQLSVVYLPNPLGLIRVLNTLLTSSPYLFYSRSYDYVFELFASNPCMSRSKIQYKSFEIHVNSGVLTANGECLRPIMRLAITQQQYL
ncbi:hypothetical protein AGLY_007997 [Aphis glycines]|uniref:Uncharacterized protein n=1 Tax=Aphis glycines TaxID=307491 RepID=A0A6G0TLX2_APHGL|nr:hypothetical protein AGLY_007997 [Aphis glycines]